MTARSTKLPNALVLLLVAFSLLCTKSYAADPTVPPCPTDDNGNQTKCPPYAANNWKNTIPQGSMVTVTTTGNPQLTNQNDTQAQTNNTLNSAVFGVESTLTGSTIAASTSTASSSNPVINITFDTQTE